MPDELIAQYPSEKRGKSRLLVLEKEKGTIIHSAVGDLASFIEPGTVVVLNDSKVRKARIYAESIDTGSSVEFLLLRRIDNGDWEAAASRLRRQRPGRRYRLAEGVEVEVIERECFNESKQIDTRVLRFRPEIDEAWIDRNGHMPLPPYIKREEEANDWERYQTVFAEKVGSSASPTAGLHFTSEILNGLRLAGVHITFVTLHVGLGTFLPVRSENIEEHRMHEEAYSIPQETANAVSLAKAEGRAVMSVGTTCLRTLESAWDSSTGQLRTGDGRTSIFIYPGYQFKVVDRLFTNFHTPRSTLLMLVSAFAGKEPIFAAYREAVSKGYRFFSYGDAMLIV